MKILLISKSLEKKDPSFEGLITIFKKLEKYLRKKHTIFINDLTKLKEVDIINIHSSGFSGMMRYKKYGAKIIYSIHSNPEPNFFKSIYDQFQYYHYFHDYEKDRMSRFSRMKNEIIFLISQLIPLSIKRYFLKKSKITIIPNKYILKLLKLKNSIVINQGININKFKKLKIKSKNDKITISYVGHPRTARGLMEVINSFSKLSSNEYDKKLFLSSKNDKIERFVKKKDKTIRVYGFRENIIEDYNLSDIIILPHRHSLGHIANPLVLLEAMACEKAIITTNLSSIKEICGDSVSYVKPYSVKQIIKTVKYLKENPRVRKELGEKARKRVIEFYNEEVIFKEYEKIFNRVIK